jgi:hypothetical protein
MEYNPVLEIENASSSCNTAVTMQVGLVSHFMFGVQIYKLKDEGRS